MFRPSVRALTLAAAMMLSTSAAEAQLFNRGCSSCGAAAAPMLPSPVSYGGYGYDPCNICPQPVAINPCVTCPPPVVMQPVQQTVYREVPVTKYRPVQKTVQKPVMRTVYEQRPVTAYRTEYETRTAEIPTTTYQTVTECQPRTVDRSHWQTSYQRVPKLSPCQYDPNPTLLGWMNRNAFALRMAMTPNYVRQRNFVPNVVAYNVPVNRVVAVPSTRQVTYNVAKLVPYESTQTVAVNKVEYQEQTVTAYEPYTEMQTVAVGTQTTYAFVDSFGGGSTATAMQPTPDTQIRSARNPEPTPSNSKPTNPPAANTTDDLFKPLSHPRQVEPTPEPQPTYYDARHRQETPEQGARPLASADGWRASKTPSMAPAMSGEVEVVVAAKK